MSTDPVCGMEVYENMAAGAMCYQDTVYYFCSRVCLIMFEDHPETLWRKRTSEFWIPCFPIKVAVWCRSIL